VSCVSCAASPEDILVILSDHIIDEMQLYGNPGSHEKATNGYIVTLELYTQNRKRDMDTLSAKAMM
jgi:hypothetical protein